MPAHANRNHFKPKHTVIINKLSLDQFTLRGSGCTVYLAVQARPLSASDKQCGRFLLIKVCMDVGRCGINLACGLGFPLKTFHHISARIVVAYWLIDRISCYLHPFMRCDAKRNDISVGASPWATN